MPKKSSIEKLQKILSTYGEAVVYKPHKDEINYSLSSFPFDLPSISIRLPEDKDSDAFAWAEKSKILLRNNTVCILIPGVKFDIFGTRHGHGGGWYDRYLSRIPKEWLRIGVANTSHVSLSPILKKSHDEVMDWLIVKDGNSWITYKTGVRKSFS